MKKKAIFKGILKIVPDLHNYNMGEAGKAKVEGLMDLNLDVLLKGKNCMVIALSHYYKLNGDLVPDPDMEIRINFEKQEAEAVSYQDIYGYSNVSECSAEKSVKLKESLNMFLYFWLLNLSQQGYKITKREVQV